MPKFDPKVVMFLSIFKIGGWNSLQPGNQKLLEEFIDENEPWLLIGIPSRDPFFLTPFLERHSVSSDQHMKNLMSLREGLHMMMECYMRQHFADRFWLHEHPGGHASWREPTMGKFTKESTTYFCGRTCVQMEHSQDAVRIKRTRAQNSSLHKQLENQNGFGELFCGACTGSLAEKLDEP